MARYSLAFARWQHGAALEETSGDGDAEEQTDSDHWQLVARLHGTVAQIRVIAAVGVAAETAASTADLRARRHTVARDRFLATDSAHRFRNTPSVSSSHSPVYVTYI